MSTINPNLNMTLTGEQIVTKLDKNITWNANEKLEKVEYFKNTDGEITLNFSDISKIRLIILETTNAEFKITFNMNDYNTIAFQCRDLFSFTPTVAFMSTVGSITLSTTSVAYITLNIRIYGEV